MGMALKNSGKPKLTLKSKSITKSEFCKIEYDFPISDENEMATDWSHIIFKVEIIMSECDLIKEGLKILMTLGPETEIKCKMGQLKKLEGEEIPAVIKKKVEIEFINKEIFKLIQDIQSQKSGIDKKAVFEKLKSVEASLEEHAIESMKLRGDKAVKKELLGTLQESKQRLGVVISELRNVQNLDQLSSHVIAKLNDVAFKGINRGGL